MTEKPIERLVAHDLHRALSLRLNSLTSSTICRRTLAKRFSSIEEGSLQSKAEGIAASVRTALGYWESRAASLSAKLLTQYYAILHFSIAAELAGPDPAVTLLSVQRHTENGHGLATLPGPGGANFPDNRYVAALLTGHFPSFCRSAGVDLRPIVFPRRPREWQDVSDADRTKLVSLTDLLRRIPELRSIVHSVLGAMPLSFHVHHSTKNTDRAFEMAQNLGLRSMPTFLPDPGSTELTTTYVDLYPDYGGAAEQLTVEFLHSLEFPITNWRRRVDALGQHTVFTGEFRHPKADYWFKYLPLYRSGTAGTALVAPIWGFDDLFLIHFLILYALSIVVRYLPSLWFDIDRGSLDHVRALFEQYAAIVDDVLPKLAIEKITGAALALVAPGSLAAPA